MLNRRACGKQAVRPGSAASSPGGSSILKGRSRWLTLFALTVVSFLLLLEDTAVSVALPAMRRDLGVSLTGLEWVVNAYTLALAVFVLPAGKLADAYGRRRTFIAGLLVFTTASLLAGMASTGDALIAARALQGTGAAFTASAALSIISVSFAKEERGAALGVWAGAAAVGLAVGPVAGATLTQLFGWPWVFLINVPLGLAAAATSRLFIPESAVRARERRLPWPAVLLWAGALLSLVTALTEAGRVGWTSLEVLALGVAGAVLLILLTAVERRSRLRLIDPSLLHSRQTIGANVLSLLSTAVMCNLFFFIALYLQLILGYGTIAAGAALLPLTAAIVLVAPLAGWISDRIGRRAPIIAGLLLLAAGLIVLSALRQGSGLPLIISGLVVAGVGIGFTTTPITAAAMDGATDRTTGESAGLLNTSRMIGLSVGIATMGAIVARGGDVLAGSPHARQAFVSGLSDALRFNAGIALLAGLIAAVTITSAVRAESDGIRLSRRAKPADRVTAGLSPDG
jgi:EmrB/QacA subfamily drug resistance transporter